MSARIEKSQERKNDEAPFVHDSSLDSNVVMLMTITKSELSLVDIGILTHDVLSK